MPATGWRSNADRVSVRLHLPPGWRLFALFGADNVQGDWLTSWTLLDVFLLVIFSLAVFKLWDWRAGVLAFFAFGLAYQEPAAPRYVWLALLLPVAVLRVVPEGWGKRIVAAWKYMTLAVLLVLLVPFVGRQIQQAIYPQLEDRGRDRNVLGEIGGGTGAFGGDGVNNEETSNVNAFVAAPAPNAPTDAASPALMEAEVQPLPANEANLELSENARNRAQHQMRRELVDQKWSQRKQAADSVQQGRLASKSYSANANLAYDSKARIQTGPGVPEWSWRTVGFQWNSPVQESQQVYPILIPLWLERLLTLLRVALLVLLAGVVLDVRKWNLPLARAGAAARIATLFFALGIALCANASADSQIPDQQTLNTLRDRLLKTPDVYPNAADIPFVSLSIKERRLVMDAEIHTVAHVSVPLPGRFPAWSPVSATVDGKSEAVVCRQDGYLWIALTPGVHRVHVEGTLPSATEWEWAFQLTPRRVSIDAPGWTYTGVRPDGVPERQIFFVQKQKSITGEAGYEQQDLRSVAEVRRNIELGLVWQVTTTVNRLSAAGKAISLRIPLLPDEKVLTPDVIVKDGFIDVRIGAHEQQFSWSSELTVANQLALETRAGDTWVERWYLNASPVWNVGFTGLSPIFEQTNSSLIPLWTPWPGEKVSLAVTRPEAISGATVTVRRVRHEVAQGLRTRESELNLDLQCSLGEDFVIVLPEKAEVTDLRHNGQLIPVRRDGNKLIVPLRPGEQTLAIKWSINQPVGLRVVADAVQLPVESANITTVIRSPGMHWVLWTHGPLRGPAVRLWGVLAVSLLAAWVLSRLSFSPLRTWEWLLLAIGLTQVPWSLAAVVVGWLFWLVWRGHESFQKIPGWLYALLQIALIVLTFVVLGAFVEVVDKGLRGFPLTYIEGNGSTQGGYLKWFQPSAAGLLPQPECVTLSVWFYRFLMLAWALWLASALLRWLKWGWTQFGLGGFFHPIRKKQTGTP